MRWDDPTGPGRENPSVPVDIRKAINGLVALINGKMALDPFSGDLLIFCNRARNLVKMVCWEGNDFVLWTKRLEKSRFQWLLSMPIDVVQLNSQEINRLLDSYALTVMQGHQQLAHHTVL